MLTQALAPWRARRVLLVGGPDIENLTAESLLHAIGARPARIPPGVQADTLCRALHAGRIGAVLVPRLGALGEGCALEERIRALSLLLSEIREAGVPLVILCSGECVYRTADRGALASEDAPAGGQTREGLFACAMQLLADGFSRGLLGDAVRTLTVRHAPCLGSGQESVAQYSAWCRALLHGSTPVVSAPDAQGVFLHPLDAMTGALMLGAKALSEPAGCQGVWNLGVSGENVIPNRSAAMRLTESEAPGHAVTDGPADHLPLILPDGTRARKLCGYAPQLGAAAALSLLMEHERALSISPAAAALALDRQAAAYLCGSLAP